MHKYIRGIKLISRNVLATAVYYYRFNLFYIPTLKAFKVTIVLCFKNFKTISPRRFNTIFSYL